MRDGGVSPAAYPRCRFQTALVWNYTTLHFLDNIKLPACKAPTLEPKKTIIISAFPEVSADLYFLRADVVYIPV